MQIQYQIGPVAGSSSIGQGVQVNARGGNMGDLIVSELQGRFYEGAYRGSTFRSGTTAPVVLTANHGVTNGLSATLATAAAATPMLGVYNPSTSTVNLVLLQAALQSYYNTVTTPTATGEMVWAVSLNNPVVSTGLAPFNSKTLAATGSQAKAFMGATALTGLSNVFTAMEAADFASGGTVAYGTIGNTAIASSVGGVQNFDGQIIVPPGAVLALYNTTNTTTFNYFGRLLWSEVPL